MTAKSTPGPWAASRAAGHHYDTRWSVAASVYSKPGITDGRDSIADVNGVSAENAEANAKLIAAAPALADALEEVLRDIDGAVETTGIAVPSEVEWYARALAALRAAGRLP